ncbi:MAG: response regulator [Anaerolineales bacterium]|nr:response regulator [Anaerolineales bacterium]MDW8161678.1 response regulator [Anaerolineales bacterium]
MSKPRLLIVEDDHDIAEMLQIFFESQGYEVEIASRGGEALERTRQSLPHLIILDIMLPDLDGFEVCRTLRTHTRTSHVPIIFLTQKDERSDKLQGLELGADDYITKPFDIEELKLRVQRAISRAEQQSLTDPRSGLPTGRLIEDQLRQIIQREGWALMDLRINSFNAFIEAYGFVAGDDVLRFTAMLLNEVVNQLGTPDDFIGHVGGSNFVVITTQDRAESIRKALKERFAQEILVHYNFLDREQGYLLITDDSGQTIKSPLMTLAIGVVSSKDHEFADIREITELAAEARRVDALT